MNFQRTLLAMVFATQLGSGVAYSEMPSSRLELRNDLIVNTAEAIRVEPSRLFRREPESRLRNLPIVRLPSDDTLNSVHLRPDITLHNGLYQEYINQSPAFHFDATQPYHPLPSLGADPDTLTTTDTHTKHIFPESDSNRRICPHINKVTHECDDGGGD
jgi:hypothetical protein